MSDGGRGMHLYNQDIADWTITFVDTGLNGDIGQRLVAVKEHLADEELFMRKLQMASRSASA